MRWDVLTLCVSLAVAVTCATEMATLSSDNFETSHSIHIEGNDFVLDGAPFRYVSGSLHYFRLPWQLWKDRLKKLRAAGLNAVSTYVEWSFHEPEEGQYRWTGDHDLVKFIQTAAEAHLLVILRPGPYICAERDLGGLPYWLLSKYPGISLRTSDKDYMREVTKWLNLLLSKMKPLLFGNGGPIFLVQVENEYGSYIACDRGYMIQLRDLMKSHVGEAALLYTTDGIYTSMINCGRVNNTLTTIDFGADTNPSSAFRTLRRFLPTGPLVNSEFYPGWLTHWGEKMHTVNSVRVVDTLKEMLDMGASVNFYVFFGGTNFEHTAGANYVGVYQPDITSYDYDAPLTEYGKPTQKYYDIKRALEQYHPWAKNLTVSNESTTADYGVVALTPRIRLLSEQGRSLLGVKPTRVEGHKLPTFESRRQRAGLMLYETVVNGAGQKLLHVNKPRDRVYVYVDGVLSGVISRMHKIYSLPLKLKDTSNISLLVENQGRINYGPGLKDFKGILGNVTLDNLVLKKTWTVLGYPLEDLNDTQNINPEHGSGSLERGPVLFEGTFVLPDEKPKDTFLDPSGWGKGYAWVNGHNLGRYWLSPGPQVTLYVPSVYLLPSPAQNLLQLVELESSPYRTNVHLRNNPIFVVS